MSDAIEVPLGGETYRMSQITLGDLTKFENRIRSERLRIALDMLPAGSKDRAEIVREILTGEVDITDGLSSMGGISYLLWLSIAHNDPSVTYDSFAEKLRLEDMRVLQTLIDKLAFGGSAEQAEDGDGPPAESSPPATE